MAPLFRRGRKDKTETATPPASAPAAGGTPAAEGGPVSDPVEVAPTPRPPGTELRLGTIGAAPGAPAGSSSPATRAPAPNRLDPNPVEARPAYTHCFLCGARLEGSRCATCKMTWVE